MVAFEEKGLGRMEGMHKTEESIAFPFLTLLYCLNFHNLDGLLLLFVFNTKRGLE